jgi:tetratricopeptide (TPR) repeat protein
MTRKRVDINTCVWGEWHLNAMRRVMLPTLLSPNNLPALCRRFPARYRIATTPSDRERIESWPIFSRLAAAIDIEWVTENPSPDISYHIEWYRRSLSDAKATNAYCFMAYPDVAWCDGVLTRCAEAVAAGKVAVAIPYLRVISETFVPEIASLAGDAEIAFSGSDLTRLAGRHMHPLSVAAMAGGQHALPSLEVSWRVPGQGVLLREISRELSMVDTERLEANQYWNAVGTTDPQSLHVAADSDDMFMLSIAPLFKDFHVYIPGHALQPMDMARVSLHPANNNPLMEHFARQRIRLHYEELDENRWRRVGHRADSFINQALFMREFLRIWEAALANGCTLGSQAMSIVLNTTPLARRWRYDGPVTAYIPTDDAFRDAGLEDIAQLLRPEARHHLDRFILNHVVPGAPLEAASHAGKQVALSGAAIDFQSDGALERVNGARILRRLDVPPHQVCIIDRLLSAPAGMAAEAATQQGSRPNGRNNASGSNRARPAARFEYSTLEKESRALQALGGLRTKALQVGSEIAATLHIKAVPTSERDIARDYGVFLRHFGLRLRGKDLQRQRLGAASALYQAGLYRQKLLFQHDLMQGFSARAGANEPQPAFFEHCSALLGGEQDLEQAERYYTLALKILPDFAEALYALALLKRRAGLAKEAIALFRAAAQATPHPQAFPHAHIPANCWRNLAEIHRDSGDGDAAEACFRKALDHLGIHGVYHEEIAAFMHQRGHYAEAVRHYELLMRYSHVYAAHFVEPNYLPDQRLPRDAAGRPCDPLKPTVIEQSADGGQLVYWWHLYLQVPKGTRLDAAALTKARPKARPPAAAVPD